MGNPRGRVAGRWAMPSSSAVRALRAVRSRDDSGAALVEFALSFPIFVMLLLGMFTGGLALHNKIVVTNASHGGSPVRGDGRRGRVLERVWRVDVGPARAIGRGRTFRGCT